MERSQGLRDTSWQHLEQLGMDIAEINCTSGIRPEEVLEQVRTAYGSELEFVELDERVLFPSSTAPVNDPRYSEQYPIELCARQWRASDEVIGRDGENLERFIQISYEDLTSEPVGVMRKVTDFLGLPALDSSVLEQAWFIRDKRKTIQNMNAGSFERLSDEDVRAIERVAGDGLAKYGYSVS